MTKKNLRKNTPARGIEPRASAWQAEMLPTTPSRKERGYYRIRTGDRRICNPMLCHWAKHPSLNSMQKNNFIWKIFWFIFLFYIIFTFKRFHRKKITWKKMGAQGDSNPRPLAPKARIIPLDHEPSTIFYCNCKLKTIFRFSKVYFFRLKKK